MTVLTNPSDECMERLYKEFGTTKAQVKEDVQTVKKWLQQQPHLPNVENEVAIESMLVRSKFNVERSKQSWDLYFSLKNTLPEFFANRDPIDPQLQLVASLINLAPLPTITDEGYRVGITRIVKRGYIDFKHDNFFKLAFMIIDVGMQVDKSNGEIHIIDLKNFSIMDLPKVALYDLRRAASCLKAYSFRIKGIHFLNPPSAVALTVILSLLKAVIKTKLVSRIHVHSKLDTLYQHVDRKILPREYGGEEESSVTDIAAYWLHKLEISRDWFLEQEVCGKTDESKRPGKSNNKTNYNTTSNGMFSNLQDVD